MSREVGHNLTGIYIWGFSMQRSFSKASWQHLGGLGIQGSWVQIPFGCCINSRWCWLCMSSFRGRQNECQLAGILCRSGDPPRIVPNSQGDCLGSTNALHRVLSQWMDGWHTWVIFFFHSHHYPTFLLGSARGSLPWVFTNRLARPDVWRIITVMNSYYY